MINVTYIKKGFKINSIWFGKDIDNAFTGSKADFIFIHGYPRDNYKKALVDKQSSLITDLSMPLEEIFQKFNRTYKRQIKKAKNDQIEIRQYDSKELKDKSYLLDSFKKDYERFVKLKGIKNFYNEGAMTKYVEGDNITLTKAFKGEVIYAQHIFIHDHEITRLLYTVSNFRGDEIDKNRIGTFNKYLHWKDIEYFKDNNFKVLDWGGMNSKENTNGIDVFKRGFGGKEVDYYNVIIGKSLLGKLALLFLKLKRGLNHVFAKIG